MHVAVSWDISAVQPQWGTINQNLVQAFGQRPFFRPVNTFYAVGVDDNVDRAHLVASLQAAGRQAPVQVLLVVSPIMVGDYDGLHNNWPALNAITQ